MDQSTHGRVMFATRIKNVNKQLEYYRNSAFLDENTIPNWNDSNCLIRENHSYTDINGQSADIFSALESYNIFFSEPMDLDFAMLKAFPNKFEITDIDTLPDQDLIKSVLGKKHHAPEQYTEEERKLFSSYHKLFKLGSKPVNHIQALADLTDEELLNNMPESLSRLADAVKTKLLGIPE